MAGLPIRVRLVAGFSVAMFVVLVGAGAFVYWRVEYALDRGLDGELSQAAATIEPSIEPGPSVPDTGPAEATGTAWQVLSSDGRVVAHGGPAPAAPLVSPAVLAEVGGGTLVRDLGSMLPAAAEPYRLHLTAVPDGDGYLVVAVRRDHRDEALRELLGQLSVAGLAALVVTAFVGERLARAALAPVERYRRRAAEISEGATGVRLDIPAGRDDEVTRLGQTLNEMLAALEASLEAQERFVHEASHELRTPLTLLKARLQLAGRRVRSVAEHEQIVDELSTDVARLIDLAEQLLSLGSATSDSPQTDAGTAEVTHVVNAAVDRQNLGRATGAGTAVVQTLREPASVSLSPVALDRIVSNLLTNAHLHGAAPVTVSIDAADGWVRIAVQDSGPGMSPELLATATARFSRAPEARARPGSGLGLSLVEALVRQSGGELRLCHEGHHLSFGRASALVCPSHPGMVASVILPATVPDG